MDVSEKHSFCLMLAEVSRDGHMARPWATSMNVQLTSPAALDERVEWVRSHLAFAPRRSPSGRVLLAPSGSQEHLSTSETQQRDLAAGLEDLVSLST